MADHAANIVTLIGPPGLIRRNVHHRHIDALGREVTGNR
jgi:hypothetical protein